MSAALLDMALAVGVALVVALAVTKPLMHAGLKAVAGITAAIIVVGGLGLYAQLGSPGTPNQPILPRQAAALGMDEDTTAFMLDRVEALAARLTQKPDDPQGWAMLGRAYGQLGRFPEAIRAFRQSIAADPQGPEATQSRLDLLRLLLMTSGGQVSSDSVALIRDVLAAAPDHGQAMFMAVTALVQKGFFAEALGVVRYAQSNLDLQTPDASGVFARQAELLTDALGAQAADRVVPIAPLDALSSLD